MRLNPSARRFVKQFQRGVALSSLWKCIWFSTNVCFIFSFFTLLCAAGFILMRNAVILFADARVIKMELRINCADDTPPVTKVHVPQRSGRLEVWNFWSRGAQTKSVGLRPRIIQKTRSCQDGFYRCLDMLINVCPQIFHFFEGGLRIYAYFLRVANVE